MLLHPKDHRSEGLAEHRQFLGGVFFNGGQIYVLFLLHREAADHYSEVVLKDTRPAVALRDNFEVLRIGL